ncbi:hypothetical protein EVAR_53032_1 [Eumeta japonica]|uniref:Uncharacterized protein n=1 Tax=Eumeta variegata TaxID=151549 RepID=A0A4C1XN93_EUMVA|nr:hypothetical protein EVAR_53032_1 [Eumeta japonica]
MDYMRQERAKKIMIKRQGSSTDFQINPDSSQTQINLQVHKTRKCLRCAGAPRAAPASRPAPLGQRRFTSDVSAALHGDAAELSSLRRATEVQQVTSECTADPLQADAHARFVFELARIILRCTLTMSNFQGLMMETEGKHRNSIMKQSILAVFGLVEIVLRCTLTMNDFQDLMMRPEGRR